MTCRHGMPSAASCMDCQYEGDMPPVPTSPPREVSEPFEAWYTGQCRGCDLPITPGQTIVRLGDKDDPNHEYRHDGCS